MKLKKLRELIKDLPDDTEVVCPGSDHSYNRASAWEATAAVHGGDFYEQDPGAPDEEKENVLVVGMW